MLLDNTHDWGIRRTLGNILFTKDAYLECRFQDSLKPIEQESQSAWPMNPH